MKRLPFLPKHDWINVLLKITLPSFFHPDETAQLKKNWKGVPSYKLFAQEFIHSRGSIKCVIVTNAQATSIYREYDE